MLSERRRLLLLFFTAGLLFLWATDAFTHDQMSLHILFTGGARGAVEPSG